MADVVVFGTTDTAQLAKFYLDTDSPHRVVGFTVHRDYLDREEFEGLPVVAFEDLQQRFPSREASLFAPMVATRMNKARAEIYQQGKDKGYSFISYVSSHATVLTPHIGENCFILEDNTVQPYVRIGNNCVLWSGNHIGHHSTIHDHVLFTSHIVLSGHCDVGSYSFFGVNATVRDGLHIGEGTLLAMGAVLTRPTEPWTAWLGNPARRHEKSSLELYR